MEKSQHNYISTFGVMTTAHIPKTNICKLSVFLTILVTTSCYLVMLSDWTVVSRDSKCVETLYRANFMEIYLLFRLHKSKKNKTKTYFLRSQWWLWQRRMWLVKSMRLSLPMPSETSLPMSASAALNSERGLWHPHDPCRPATERGTGLVLQH